MSAFGDLFWAIDDWNFHMFFWSSFESLPCPKMLASIRMESSILIENTESH